MATPMMVLEQEPSEETRGSIRLLKSQHQEIEAETERAKSLIGQPDPDGDIVYSAETLERAIAFLKLHIEWLWRVGGTRAPMPTIGPGPAGSVDLFWKRRSWKLLVNIPSPHDALANFYGDDYGKQKVKGTIDPEKVSHTIAACLME